MRHARQDPWDPGADRRHADFDRHVRALVAELVEARWWANEWVIGRALLASDPRLVTALFRSARARGAL